MKESQIAGVLTPILAQFGLELEAVEIIPAGKRRLLRVVVDGDGPDGPGPLLDDIAEASKAVSVALDSTDVTGASPYTLEVSSRGVGRPLELPRHWRRNRAGWSRSRLRSGEHLTGRIVSARRSRAAGRRRESSATLASPTWRRRSSRSSSTGQATRSEERGGLTWISTSPCCD